MFDFSGQTRSQCELTVGNKKAIRSGRFGSVCMCGCLCM